MDSIDLKYYSLKNKAIRVLREFNLLLDKQQRKILKENKMFKDIHKGKRCFIIGSGPSLKKQDLSLLCDEYVFTVNYFAKSEKFEEVKSNYHILMDPAIFVCDESNYNLHSEELLRINTEDNHPTCFVPYNVKNQISNSNLSNALDFRFIHFGYGIYEGYDKKIDLTNITLGFSNVVLFAAMIAIYMGFKEIYFIGCDMTGYEQISVMAGKDIELHAYAMDDKERANIKIAHQEKISAENFFEGFYKMFMEFRLLNNYANKINVKLFNATEGGVLQELERVPYESLF